MAIGILILLLVTAAGVIAYLAQRLRAASDDAAKLRVSEQALRDRFVAVLDIDAEVETQRRELARLKGEIAKEAATWAAQKAELSASYGQSKATYDKLCREVALLEENMENLSFGLYKPHYDFDASENFKAELERVWERKKAMIKDGAAATCATKWSMGDNAKDGARMVKGQIKLMLRAFNGECDAAIAKVTWNNVTRMEERINKALQAVNDAGAHLHIVVHQQYADLALAELRLTHEYAAKKREEQEEQRAIREQMREEERAQREYEKAERDAATEQERYEKALAKARADVASATGAALDAAASKVQELEAKLAEAQAKAQRAMSMAQQTRSGHVYVISNIGSFGDDVFKIGMTRRLEPMERVHELGDASVPFAFDVHAMIYSEDAPGLENELHKNFGGHRLNLVNMRKEFFRVPLAHIEAFAHQRKLPVVITKLAEAREHRESLAIRLKAEAAAAPPVEAFPAALSA